MAEKMAEMQGVKGDDPAGTNDQDEDLTQQPEFLITLAILEQCLSFERFFKLSRWNMKENVERTQRQIIYYRRKKDGILNHKSKRFFF